MKFIILQFSPRQVYISFRSKYPPQHSVLKNPQSMFLPQSERPSSAPTQYNWQNYSLSSIIKLLFIFTEWYIIKKLSFPVSIS